MLSRRVRIKGIANIPARKKTDKTEKNDDQNETETSNAVPSNNSSATSGTGKHQASLDENVQSVVDSNTASHPSEQHLSFSNTAEESSSLRENVKPSNEQPTDFKENGTSVEKSSNEETEIENGVPESPVGIHIPNAAEETMPINTQTPTLVPKQPPVKLPRRSFIKPTINIAAVNRRSKVVTEEKLPDETKNPPEPELNTVPETVNVESALDPKIPDSPKTALNVNIKSNSDAENATLSTKILSRTRIRPVPRLGGRRNSVQGSASESEDDNRRLGNRIRNDSVCSNVSLPSESNFVDAGSNQRKQYSSVIQRKCKRSDLSRKMAEARREFNRKFAQQNPNKSCLTMLDLLFYNPLSNPMSNKNDSSIPFSSAPAESTSKEEEEKEDDPVVNNEENEMPGPRVKVDENGEIIVDEQSLVIEQTRIKKDKERIQKSEAVLGDFPLHYGVYKRAKRSKDWSKIETLRFYKALNTVGTDFSMMKSLFPKRTRNELKMKFKKEERINRQLIDKALLHPQNFDLSELEEQIKKEEEELKRQKIAKQVAENERKERREKKEREEPKKKKPSTIMEKIKVPKGGIHTNRKRNLYKPLANGVEGVLKSDSESDVHDSDSSDNNSEILRGLARPTRSGRIPKIRRLDISESSQSETEETSVETETSLATETNAIPAPGSLMVLTSKTPEGLPVYKVFMVTQMPANYVSSLVQNITNAQDDTNVMCGTSCTNNALLTSKEADKPVDTKN